MAKVKKGDTVIVTVGKNKGQRGTVQQLAKPDYLIVEGINLAKKHKKGNPQRDLKGGIVEIEKPIYISNVALYNPVTKKADRVGFKLLDDGRKVRYFKSNNEVIDL